MYVPISYIFTGFIYYAPGIVQRCCEYSGEEKIDWGACYGCASHGGGINQKSHLKIKAVLGAWQSTGL